MYASINIKENLWKTYLTPENPQWERNELKLYQSMCLWTKLYPHLYQANVFVYILKNIRDKTDDSGYRIKIFEEKIVEIFVKFEISLKTAFVYI